MPPLVSITGRVLPRDGPAPTRDSDDLRMGALLLSDSALACGILLAWAVMFGRILGLVLAVNRELLWPLLPPMLAMGAVTIPEIFDPQYYTGLEGGLLESIGRLFKGDMTLFIYPYCNKTTGNLTTVENMELPPIAKPLFDYVNQAKQLVSLENHDPACARIDSRDVLKKIASGDASWEEMVPPPIVELIKERHLFGHKVRRG